MEACEVSLCQQPPFSKASPSPKTVITQATPPLKSQILSITRTDLTSPNPQKSLLINLKAKPLHILSFKLSLQTAGVKREHLMRSSKLAQRKRTKARKRRKERQRLRNLSSQLFSAIFAVRTLWRRRLR
jgi:hypothetical protein